MDFVSRWFSQILKPFKLVASFCVILIMVFSFIRRDTEEITNQWLSIMRQSAFACFWKRFRHLIHQGIVRTGRLLSKNCCVNALKSFLNLKRKLNTHLFSLAFLYSYNFVVLLYILILFIIIVIIYFIWFRFINIVLLFIISYFILCYFVSILPF